MLFVKGIGKRDVLAGRENRFCGVAYAMAPCNEPAKENLHCNKFDACAGCGETIFFALHQMVREMGGGDVSSVFDLVSGFKPIGQRLEHAADKELVVDGEAALGGKVKDKGVDGGEHPEGERECATSASVWQRGDES